MDTKPAKPWKYWLDCGFKSHCRQFLKIPLNPHGYGVFWWFSGSNRCKKSLTFFPYF
jgi:hypothetical protein